jgi:hypothetical protein
LKPPGLVTTGLIYKTAVNSGSNGLSPDIDFLSILGGSMKWLGLVSLALLFIIVVSGTEVFADNYNCQLSNNTILKIKIDKGHVFLFSGVTKFEKSIAGIVTKRNIKGYNSKGKTLFGGLTLFVTAFGFTETYEGNGIEDGEAIFAVDSSALAKMPNQLKAEFLSTGEEGELDIDMTYCSRIN